TFADRHVLLLDVCFVLFLAVSLGDILDGYLARKYKEVTRFGRIADPFVDKVVVCGSFAFFLTIEPLDAFFPAWFVVVILAREFLVHGIRSSLEASGVEFGASVWGKAKTFVQNFTVGSGFVYTTHLQGRAWAEWILVISIVLTLAATVGSGLVYVAAGVKAYRRKKD
ncbi:MAG: CDP-alcohol phosphatidyltransferase family protein, partial [Planctomycetota bacterium]